MRLVIDLQAAQGCSKPRGIGRYSLALARAIAARRGGGELFIALNGQLGETIEPLRAAFHGLIPEENVRVWHGMSSVAARDPANDWRRQASEQVREAFLASLKPDVVHTASLFEGVNDDVVTSVGALTTAFDTAVTLYDLIPLVHRETYLRHPQLERWYFNKLSHLQRADLWLAISEHSRREAIEHLSLPTDRVVRIAGAADGCFQPLCLPPDRIAALRTRYGLADRFAMYTGGIDHRKNIEGLLQAYALLPADLRSENQLLIVCHAEKPEREHLQRRASGLGLRPQDLVLSGFVPDDDLVALYNLCAAFVFPSWHEGLGLPVLEAMACGAPVIASDCSSLPEIVGRADALFDPHDPKAIAGKLTQLLRDTGFCDELRAHGLKQSALFSWDETARLALEALDNLHDMRLGQRRTHHALPCTRPHLVMVSPLPPQRSDIADYAADILPALARHYDVDVVIDQAKVKAPFVEASCRIRDVDWFRANAHRCDRIVYQFGNSHFHKHMLGMLEQFPGIVVLHDFYLSGLFFHMEISGIAPGSWSDALYDSHGYHALAARFEGQDAVRVMADFPANLAVLRNALGVIVHSEFARELAGRWYAPAISANWAVIPQVRASECNLSRAAARRRLGIAEDDFLVCSFGILAATKMNHRLVQAWIASRLRSDVRARLVFVGDHFGSDYGRTLQRTVRKHGLADRITIKGFCSGEDYRSWLAAADAAVQLRKSTRGETSRAVLDCASAGLAVVVNAHGTMRDFPAAIQLPDEFSDEELSKALEQLRQDTAACRKMGERSRAHIRARHAPRQAAEQYAAAIEGFHAAAPAGRRRLLSSVARLDPAPADKHSWAQLAQSVAHSLPDPVPARQLLVDVSNLDRGSSGRIRQANAHQEICNLVTLPAAPLRAEPVWLTEDGALLYARIYTCRLLGLPERLLADDPIDYAQGDVYLNLCLRANEGTEPLLQEFRNCGGLAYQLIDDAFDSNRWATAKGHSAALPRILPHLSQFDGALCGSRDVAVALLSLLDSQQPTLGSLRIGFLEDPAAPRTAGTMPWQRCVEMLADASHRNWLGRWTARDIQPALAPTATARVA
jgi:glycosyltransferase involved in cell wall biosynthesis